MRINRNTLLKIANDTVSNKTRQAPGIISAYLCGALCDDDYLLGGTADIDLVFIHIDTPAQPREILSLTEEVHLDISHHAQKEYDQTRRVRAHPWLGPTVFACKPLYDTGHYLDFIQASVRGQFDQPDNILQRACPQAEHARQMWFSLQTVQQPEGLKDVALYLRAVEHAVNAIALLSGPPLTERRFLLQYPDRAQAVGRPGLYPGLLGLLGANHTDTQILQAWLPAWEQTLAALPEPPVRLHPHRKYYYLRAFEALLKMPEPRNVLWPLVKSWTHAVAHQPLESPLHQTWQQMMQQLGLLGGGFSERVSALDAYLDMVEETLEDWATAAGA